MSRHSPFIAATVYEEVSELDDVTIKNAQYLQANNVAVMVGINGKNIDKHFGGKRFGSIIFMFPNCGSRDPVYSHNPNFVLVREFLRSAKSIITDGGLILITAVKSSHYRGRFRLDEAAEFAQLKSYFTIPFYPDDYPAYSHTNTNDDKSAAAEYDQFETWVFNAE